MKEFQIRTIYGALFAIVVLSATLLGPWSYALLFGAFSLLILNEFYNLARLSGISPQKLTGLAIGLLIFVFSFLSTKKILQINLTAVYLAILFMVPTIELFRSKVNALENMAVTLFGILYIIFPFSLFNYFVFPDQTGTPDYNPSLLLFLILFIWAFDSGAYIFGVAFGKHRLLERISPKKSWEGFFGGWFLALVCAQLLHFLFPDYSLFFLMVIGTVVTLAGTLGDLVESMIKRNLGVKDSGKFLPGHGGLLDRFDSIIFASPIVYLVISILSK